MIMRIRKGFVSNKKDLLDELERKFQMSWAAGISMRGVSVKEKNFLKSEESFLNSEESFYKIYGKNK